MSSFTDATEIHSHPLEHHPSTILPKVRLEVLRYQSPHHPTLTYENLDQRQRQIAHLVRQGHRGALLLSEVAPVITLGRRASEQDILMNPHRLKQLGIQVLRTDRGGLATYHGPGQWLVFPVDRLEVLCGDSRGVRKTVEGLLDIALTVGRKYCPQAQILSGEKTGVWTPRGKFASVGVHIENGVLHHGLSVNGFRTPTSFQGLRPCGLDAPVDFLLSQRSDENSVDLEKSFWELGQALAREACSRFWQNLT